MARTKPLRPDTSKPHRPPLGLEGPVSPQSSTRRWQMRGPSLPPLCPVARQTALLMRGLQEAGQEGLLGLSGVKHDVILML